MEPFASVSDYEQRYGEPDDPELIEEVLMDATREISAALERAGIDPEGASEAYRERLMQACRSMAFRAIGQGEADIPLGVTQYSQGAGDFTASWSVRNPFGEVYLSKAELRLLGLGRARIGSFIPGGP